MRGRSLFLLLTFLHFVQWGTCVDPYPSPVAYECNSKFPPPPMVAPEAGANIRHCPEATSVIQTNIDKVVAQLVAKVSPSGFTTTSTGSGASTIYGLLQCRADVNARDCTACGKEAQREINDRCAKDGKARFWFERCFLRYDTENFIGKLDRMDYYVTYNNAGNASNPKVFTERVRKLMGEVTAMAVVPGKGALGKGQITVSPKVTLYGAAECTRDLAPSVCSGCLATAVSKFGECCVGKERGRVLFGSCSVHYEVYPFF